MPPPSQDADRYHGFSLSSVCWGYRDIFAQTLETLFAQGLIGDKRPEVTDQFFAFMRCSDEHAFDHVLRGFLSALNPQTAWILDLPGVFAEVTEMGRQLAETKLYYGVTYFRVMGEGGFGKTPTQVRTLIDCLHQLRAVDDDLAIAFLRGYGRLAGRLTPTETRAYLEEGIAVFRHNRRSGLGFLEGALKSAEATLRSLTQECRLEDVRPSLERMLRALVGYEVEVSDLGHLDSDALIERDTRMVCMYRWLYLPARVRHFARAADNRNWYRLYAVVAAAMLAWDSFPRIHGHPRFATCADLVGDDFLCQNLFQLVEYARTLRRARERWPGSRSLISVGIDTEFEVRPPVQPVDRLLQALLRGTDGVPLARELIAVADTSVNAFDTAALTTPSLIHRAAAAYPRLGQQPLRTLLFLPDFSYPGTVGEIPRDALVADLKQRARRRQEQDARGLDPSRTTRQPSDRDGEQEEQGDGAAIDAAFVYDEWSQPEGDYYADYCRVHEFRPESSGSPRDLASSLPEEVMSLAAKTRRIFELLRPEWGKEKQLPEGDTIDVDRLTRFLVLRKREPSPKIDFYEKRVRNRRDLAALVLLDVSGSTGQDIDKSKAIEIEKRAALILGQGLSALDDRFAVCGFSGNGREHCEFLVYKDFDDAWDRDAMSSVLSAYPRSATRIGAALRHAGYRLSLVPARQRLILLITDGKPTDTGYDPSTRYAQHDVRMACVENRRQDIHTFCVSTLENSQADMEVMFPERMYAILPDIRRLPYVLPRLYIRMTA